MDLTWIFLSCSLQVYFEFKKKQREQSLPEKKVQAANVPKNQKQFADYVIDKQYNKMRAMVSKGFDPNFNMENGGKSNIPEMETI
jgi:hypothetical protein